MIITHNLVKIFKSGANKLNGSKKRQFMADVANELGFGGKELVKNNSDGAEIQLEKVSMR